LTRVLCAAQGPSRVLAAGVRRSGRPSEWSNRVVRVCELREGGSHDKHHTTYWQPTFSLQHISASLCPLLRTLHSIYWKTSPSPVSTSILRNDQLIQPTTVTSHEPPCPPPPRRLPCSANIAPTGSRPNLATTRLPRCSASTSSSMRPNVSPTLLARVR
jgi:hypothetical protein